MQKLVGKTNSDRHVMNGELTVMSGARGLGGAQSPSYFFSSFWVGLSPPSLSKIYRKNCKAG